MTVANFESLRVGFCSVARCYLGCMITDHLFVYGTLRREYGHPLYQLMMANGSSLGRATARGTLLAVSYYPALVRGSGDGVVVGELIRLHSPDMILERIDRYEHISADDPLPIRTSAR